MLELSTPKREAVKLWSITAQSSTGLSLKGGISETRSSENPTGSFSDKQTNQQTKTGLLLSSGEWERAGISPGTKQRQTHLPPATPEVMWRASLGQEPKAAHNACLPSGCVRHWTTKAWVRK